MKGFCWEGGGGRFSGFLLKCKKFILEKILEFFKLWAAKFHSSKYKKITFFEKNIYKQFFPQVFYLLSLGNSFLKYEKLFNLGARKFHFPKYKKILFWKGFFSERFFFFFYLGRTTLQPDYDIFKIKTSSSLRRMCQLGYL